MEETALTLTWDQVTGIALNIGLFFCIFLVLALVSYTKAFCALRDIVLEKLGVEKAPKALSVPALLFWTVLFLILLFSLITVIFNVISNPVPLSEDAITEQRWLLVRMTALVATLGAVVALPFTLIKTRQSERQTKATEEGLITDRINNAVEGLGAEKKIDRIGRTVMRPKPGGGEEITIEWKDKPIDGAVPVAGGKWEVFSETRPNLEVRIGAILALERLARNNLDIHVQIMEILCAYIRENAPASGAKNVATVEIYTDEKNGPLREDWKDRLEAFHAQLRRDIAGLKPREDIQVVLTVLGRRNAQGRLQEARHNNPVLTAEFIFDGPGFESLPRLKNGLIDQAELEDWKAKRENYQGYRLDLRYTDLQGANLSNLNLNGALMEGVFLQGSNLSKTQLQGANLGNSFFHGASLAEAQLQGVIFSNANLQGVNLAKAQLQCANLSGAQLQSAYLRGAQAECVSFTLAGLQHANLVDVQFRGARLILVHMQDADLSKAQLQGAFLITAMLRGVRLIKTQFDQATEMTDVDWAMATVKGVDFSTLPQIRIHLNDMLGDSSIRLPEGLNSPVHWPKFDLDWPDFHEEWEKWKANPDTYVPPDQPSWT